jgi:hypothetical protein
MTPPSEWRELSRAEITTARITNASSLKSAALMSDYDILNKWMQYSESETKILVGRMKMQKIEDAKLQIMAQNPALLGVGIPADEEEENSQEIGATPEGPNQEVSPDIQQGETPPETNEMTPPENQQPVQNVPKTVPKASEEDIEKYDMGIMNYAAEEDIEEVDPVDYE